MARGPDGEAAIEATGVEVPAGGQRHRRGSPRRRREPDPDPVRQRHQRNRSRRGSLTVRHTAAAPAVDVRAACCSPMSRTLTRARPTCRQGPTRPMPRSPARSRSPSASLLTSSSEGVNTIVYAWGSADDGNLQLATQTIDGLHSAPAGVPGGEAGLAPEGSSTPLWAWMLGAGSATALVLAGVAGSGPHPTLTDVMRRSSPGRRGPRDGRAARLCVCPVAPGRRRACFASGTDRRPSRSTRPHRRPVLRTGPRRGPARASRVRRPPCRREPAVAQAVRLTAPTTGTTSGSAPSG